MQRNPLNILKWIFKHAFIVFPLKTTLQPLFPMPVKGTTIHTNDQVKARDFISYPHHSLFSLVYCSASYRGIIIPSQGHLGMSGDIFGCHYGEEELAFSG